jgi:cytochrome c556
MQKQTRWTLVGAALVAITASCEEPPATERDNPAPTSPEVTAEVTGDVAAAANLPLKEIMQGLEGDLATLAHGLWIEDREVVRQAAGRIADHPRVIPTQMVSIQTALGSSFPSFVAHDQNVHQAALALAEAADSMMSVSELFDGYLRIQRGCLSCHMAFRAPVSEAVTDEGDGA